MTVSNHIAKFTDRIVAMAGAYERYPWENNGLVCFEVLKAILRNNWNYKTRTITTAKEKLMSILGLNNINTNIQINITKS